MTNITYWGDMLNAVNAYVAANYTSPTAYRGPDGDGTLDGRIALNGDGDDVYEPASIVPLTILHHNDSHGNLAKGTYVGYTQLATLIKQERAHNPTRTLLLSAGDNIQGDAMMYYFRTAPTGLCLRRHAPGPGTADQPADQGLQQHGLRCHDPGQPRVQLRQGCLHERARPGRPSRSCRPMSRTVAHTGWRGRSSGIQPYVTKTVGAKRSRSPSWASATTASPTTNCPATSPA